MGTESDYLLDRATAKRYVARFREQILYLADEGFWVVLVGLNASSPTRSVNS